MPRKKKVFEIMPIDICIIGFGYVGKAMFEMLRNHYNIAVKDTGPGYKLFKKGDQYAIDDYAGEATPFAIANKAKLVIVCVPTPMNPETKECDTNIVESVIAGIDKSVPILIKSTIKPGTTDDLIETYGNQIAFSPEYAGESSYWSPYKFDKDMKECPFVVIGGEPAIRRHILDILVPVLGPTKTYYQTTAKAAEVVKYMENTYFGVKVTFANEMKNICDALGVDYYDVRTAWALDPRVDPMHTMVFPGAAGFGGKCLPKDINGIVKAAEAAGYDAKFLKEVLASNDRYRNATENNT